MIRSGWEKCSSFTWIGNIAKLSEKLGKFLWQCITLPKNLWENTHILKRQEKLQREQAEAIEGLLYFILLRELWPEAAQSFVPRIGFSPDSIADIRNQYICNVQPRALQKRVSAMLVQMAEGLVELPLVDRIALFEEAVRPRAESMSWMYSKYIIFLTRYGHDDELLLQVCSRFENLGQNVWDSDCAWAWVCYLALLLRKGEEKSASKLLALYVAKHGLKKIAAFPRLALFARDLGFRTPDIAASASLMELGRTSAEERVLERYLAGKTVAVVGSSPLELGRGRGEEIDSHDIVVRVNILPQPEYLSDFGQKTSIFVKNLSQTVDFPKLGAADLILGMEGLERHFFSPRAISGFTGIARDNSNSLVFPPLGRLQALLRRSPFTQFSSGVLAATYLKDLVPRLTRANLFGFTHFLDGETRQYGDLNQHHYFCVRPQETLGNSLFQRHSLKREREFLYSVFPEIS